MVPTNHTETDQCGACGRKVEVYDHDRKVVWLCSMRCHSSDLFPIQPEYFGLDHAAIRYSHALIAPDPVGEFYVRGVKSGKWK